MKPRSLYIHVPFCSRRCSYCDFAVHAVRRPPVDAWLDAVETELARVAEQEGWSRPLELETLYLGGGTPSLLGVGAMSDLRRRLERYAVWDGRLEWTAEANPESFDAPLAEEWAGIGVNRVSLGVQTFHDPALRWMGRLHGSDAPSRAVAAARAAGIAGVNVDLIFGLPAKFGRDWARDLERALELEPNHISLYGLTAESGTPLGRWVVAGREQLADDEGYAAEYLRAAERLSGAGMRHYEVSNFARPGHESRHNQVYWTGEAYLGLGPGAHSLLPPERRWNARDWLEYRNTLVARGLPVAGRERVEGDALGLERIWLALRTAGGMPTASLGGAQQSIVASWKREGLAQQEEGAVRLTARGWLLLDRLAVDLADVAGERPSGRRLARQGEAPLAVRNETSALGRGHEA